MNVTFLFIDGAGYHFVSKNFAVFSAAKDFGIDKRNNIIKNLIIFLT